MRPIDADKHIAYLTEKRNVCEDFDDVLNVMAYEIAIKEIKAADTIDAEPVVRCKDCVHRNKEEVFYRSSNDSCSCRCEWFSSYQGVTGGIYTSENDYCSYGAKMDEEVK